MLILYLKIQLMA